MSDQRVRINSGAERDSAPIVRLQHREDSRIVCKEFTSVCDDDAVARRLTVEMPTIVVLCLGGNDVYGISGNVLVVGMRLYEYAQSLVAMGVKHVVVCQIIRRQCVRRLSWDEGTQRVLEINEFLRAVSDTDRLSFWVHRGFWQSLHNIFRADGVHFNDRGNFKLWRSIKGAIFGALKRVHGER